MKEMKRVLALVLCFVMLVGVLPVGALAADAETTAPSVTEEVPETSAAAEATEAAADTEASEIETSAPETTVAPETTEAEEAAYYEADAPAAYSANDNIDYLFVATDRHTNTTIIGNIIDNMESAIGENELDYLGLGGDMVGSGNSHPGYNSSTVLEEVTGATSSLDADNVDIVAGIHDMNVTDDAGIVLPYTEGGAQIYEGDKFYVYGVEEYCISDDSGESYWTTEAEKFVNWANSVEDTSKAIIVVSHYPLHAKRDDNDGAYIWHTALNDVATNDAGEVVRDVVFFHGHNHTVDSNEYVYNVGDTMSIQNGSSTTSETIQYTYATAGYLNQNSKATLVTITDSTICLDKYTTSGVGETMASVTRVVEEVEEETTAPTETEPAETEATEPEAVAPSKVEVSGTDTYTQGDDLTITVKGYTYSVDGTTSVDIALADCEIAISCPEGHDCTLDTVMDTVATGTDNDYHQITVTYMGVSGVYYFTVGAAEDLIDKTTGVTVTVNSAVTGAITVAESANENVAAAMEAAEVTNYVAYDITPEIAMDPGNYAVVSLPIPEGVTNPVVYYVSDDGLTVTDMNATDNGDGTVSFTTDHFSTYVVGTSTKITVPDPEKQTGSTTVGGKKTVYVLASSISSGTSYLIVNSDSAGSCYALANNNGSVAATAVTVKTDDIIGTYIELDDATDELWTTSASIGSSTSSTLKNGSYYLYASSDGIALDDSTGNNTNWRYDSSDRLYRYRSGRTSYYLYNNNGSWGATDSTSTADAVYFYVPTEVDTTTTTTGVYSIEGTPAEVTQVVAAPVTTDGVTTYTTGTLGYAITFTTEDGTEKTLTADEITALGGTVTLSTTFTDANGNEVNGDPAGIIQSTSGATVSYSGNYGTAVVKITYSWTVDGTAYSINNYIEIEATEPYYSLELHEAEPIYTEVGTLTEDEYDETVVYYILNEDGTYEQAPLYWEEGVTYYTITGATPGAEITAPIALKGVEEGDIYSVWAIVKEHTSENPDGAELGDVEDDRIYWDISNTSIATIDTHTGVITFTGEQFGIFTVTAYYMSEDGEDILAEDTITFSVTDSQYTIPSDGTNDFPDYPNEGSIRLNKTADAVGNFSETGLAKVEISMTGVPYTAGNELDVVLMLDITGSMHDKTSSSYTYSRYVRVEATIIAAKAFVEDIVVNEDGSYNGNRVGVYSFNSKGTYTLVDLGTISSDAELEAAYDAIEGFDDNYASGGTPYDDGLALVQTTLSAAKTTNLPEGVESAADYDRKQFAVFMTDGVPTDYEYVTSTGHANYSSASSIAGMLTSSDNYQTRDTDYYYEYYSTEMKEDGVTVYSVGLGLENTNSAWSGTAAQCLNLASRLLNDISGPAGETEQPDAVGTSTLSKKDTYFFSVDDADAASKMENVFSNIAQSIKEAATDVQVVDKVGSDYTVSFKFPNDTVATNASSELTNFYIQVVEYTLDSTTKERVDTDNDGNVDEHATVKENFTFNGSTGALVSHTSDKGTSCTADTCTHVTFTDGVVTAINGDYFTYESTDEGEFLTWNEEKISSTELALQYIAYLDNSAGTNVNDQVEAGSYYTNEWASVTYTNHLGNECQQYFPQPQMTWNGAQVTYIFYLVNENGEPVNRAGRVIPFANAIFVTDPVTYSVTWNDLTGTETMLAQDLYANTKVPEVYELYDKEAYYEVRVYQTEGVDTNSQNWNFFQIDGSDDITNKTTTKVYNTLAGTRYQDYGVYSEKAVGTILTSSSGTVTSTVQATDIDYANTTVAFAVVWKPELQPDTVVIDYGLDVVINVATNDALTSGVVGVRTDIPKENNENVTMNSGTYTRDEDATLTEVPVTIGTGSSAMTIATASVEPGSNQAVRFSLDKTNGMQFTEPAKFYYESDCLYYTYDDDGKAEAHTESMYSQVTVIPATTVYYEDEYITKLSYVGADGTISGIADGGWAVEGSTITATQAVDRPGAWQGMDPSYDANNEYGYDAAYNSSTTWSMGSALKVNVSGSDYAIAEFDFYGTGFDIISMTGNDTGVITVKVKNESGEVVKTLSVDTYYGYTYGEYEVIYTCDGYNWFQSEVNEITDATTTTADSLPQASPELAGTTYAIIEELWQPCTTDEAIYQVPVIKADLSDLGWGKYTVRINVAYHELLDHVDGSDNYNFYLDAIRIYDPINPAKMDTVIDNKGTEETDDDLTIEGAYAADNEGWPDYQMVRDMLVSAEDFDATDTDTVEGVVFIDGANTSDIATYANYGPNNEVYLTNGQSIAFEISNLTNVADVQLGLKCATEGNVIAELSIYNGTTWVSTPGNIENTDSATDRYYSIGAYLDDIDAPIVVIKNTSSGILSITNVKTTYLSAPTEVTAASYRMSAASVNAVLMMLNAEPEEEAPVVLPDAELEVSVSSKSVKVGNKVTVKVTTSEDVDYLTVNGEEITEYKQNKKTGKRSWTVKVTPEEAGDMDIVVAAYNADGYELDSVTETVQVEAKKNGNVNKVIGQLLDKLFG